MELILSALATCGAFELVEILKKQRQVLEEMKVQVVGHRLEGPAAKPFSHIDMQFYLTGTIKRKKAERALDLAMDKYCSVRASLHPDIQVTYHITINGES
jgi:putative redox protein